MECNSECWEKKGKWVIWDKDCCWMLRALTHLLRLIWSHVLDCFQGSAITHVATERPEEPRKRIAVSDDYIVYGLQKAQIRVIHRTGIRALLKHHESPLIELRSISYSSLDIASLLLRVLDGRHSRLPESLVRERVRFDLELSCAFELLWCQQTLTE